MYPPDRHSIDHLLNRPMGRRGVLALGARAASVLSTAVGLGTATGLLQSLMGCQRAPGIGVVQEVVEEEREPSARARPAASWPTA